MLRPQTNRNPARFQQEHRASGALSQPTCNHRPGGPPADDDAVGVAGKSVSLLLSHTILFMRDGVWHCQRKGR